MTINRPTSHTPARWRAGRPPGNRGVFRHSGRRLQLCAVRLRACTITTARPRAARRDPRNRITAGRPASAPPRCAPRTDRSSSHDTPAPAGPPSRAPTPLQA